MMVLIFRIISALSFCGAMESGIIGGREVKPHSLPYMVSVQINKKHVCGGMLIRNNFVLTSAHCINSMEFSENSALEVVLGAHNISHKESQQQRIRVEKHIQHPCYKKKEFQNDIMLLKLKSKAKLNNNVKVLHLPETNEKITAHKDCTIAGWGKTSQDSSASSVLYETTLKIQFEFECRNIWKDNFDSQCMMCTVSNGKTAFCQGDSGSPLICDKKPVGIAAYTFSDCLKRKYPEVYIKISCYSKWIKDVVG